MNDLDELSERLIKHGKFTNELRAAFERFYEQKNPVNKADDFIRPSLQSSGFNLKQRPLQEDDGSVTQNRCSMSSWALYKRESQDSISSMTSNPIFNQYMHSNSNHSTLNQITNEIASLLSQMIKRQSISTHTKVITTPVTVESSNISELIQKMSQIQKEQSEKIKQMIEQKITRIKTEVEEQVFSIVQKLKEQRKSKKILQKASQIKKQRRKVTQSILDMSKNNQEMSTFSNIYDVGNILSDSEDEENSERKNSPDLSQLSEKISEVEKSQSKISKQYEDRFTREVQQNSRDIQSLTERIIEWKMKNEEKLQNGFTGVWNVLTDIEDKLNKVALKVAELEHIVHSG